MGIVRYSWRVRRDVITGGKTETSYYNERGNYTIELTVRDKAGNSDTDTVNITVEDRTPPTAKAGANVTVGLNEKLTLNAADSTDNVGIVGYTWTINGKEYEGIVKEHNFEETRVYEVKLTVTDSAVDSDTATVVITVKDYTAPTAFFDISGELKAGKEITLNASASTDNGGIASYEWELGDGISASGMNVAHTYEKSCDYTVSLTVTDEGGNTDTYETTISVEKKDSDGGMSGFTIIAFLTSISFVVLYRYRKKRR